MRAGEEQGVRIGRRAGDWQSHPFGVYAKGVATFDKFGAATVVLDLDDGQVTLNLGPSPVYLHFDR